MKVYTSYFSNVKNLPSDVVPISIALKTPETWAWYEYKRLAPKRGFFQEWKKNHDNVYYIREFKAQVLDKLNPHSVMRELMFYGEKIALICYEKPGDFCHRHLVARWLKDAGYDVEEYL